MTDMTAPDKIWASVSKGKVGTILTGHHDKPVRGWQEYTRSDLIPAQLAEARAEGRREGIREAANVALNACLVPPDGGSPTEEEVAVCDAAYRHILALLDTPAPEPAVTVEEGETVDKSND